MSRSRGSRPRAKQAEGARSATSGTKAKSAQERSAQPESQFILTYGGIEDPDPEVVAKLVKALAPAKVEEVLPGTLKVQGDGLEIAREAEKLGEWSLSKEGVLSAAPPSKTRLDLFRS